MKYRTRHIFQIAAGIIIASGGMYIFFRDVDIAKLFVEIRQIQLRALGGVIFLSVITLWFRALRWQLILPQSDSANNKGLFSIVTIGFMVNNVFPARLGEFTRIFLLWKRKGFTPSESIGSLVVERFLDVIIYMAFFFIPVLIQNKNPYLDIYAIIMSGIFVLILLTLLLYARVPLFIRSMLKKTIVIIPYRFREKMIKIGREFISNLNWVFSPQKVVKVTVLSLLTVICYPLMLLLLVGRVSEFGMLDSIFSQAFAAVGAAIPLSPGYVGTLHAILLQGLTMTGLSSDKARAITIVYHGILYISTTLLGLIYFFNMNMTFKELQNAEKNLSESHSAKHVPSC
jgi:glycosyltransferase 2 family protein